jgi:hypothetical protein
MRNFLGRTVIVFFFLLSHFGLQAQSPSFVLPSAEPTTTLALPNGLKLSDVSLSVSKALAELEWENLGWEGNTTTATSKQSRIIIKVFAVASAADVKFYTEYTNEAKVSEERCKQIALRQLRALEKNIAEQLKLYFRKAKGDDTADRATVD